MADPTQYTFDLKEVAAALIRAQGIHEGRWMIGVEFNFGAGNVGASGADALPAGIVRVQKIVLTKQPPDAPDSPIIIDAANVAKLAEGRG